MDVVMNVLMLVLAEENSHGGEINEQQTSFHGSPRLYHRRRL
jgi:hypothetical protein